MPQKQTLGILVGGGPAPGINGVIAAATIEAINSGLRVVGIQQGYYWLARGDASHAAELQISDVSRIHFTGGSILGTSRTNPARERESLERAVRALQELSVRYLVCIGGDDTTTGAAKIAECAGRNLSLVTVPKTIDNDLPLPENLPTFGFETARSAGTTVVESLMEDARTTGRWYTVVTMGRTSGALALGMCKAAGATLALIPEEFLNSPLELATVVDLIAGAIIKRCAQGRQDGVALISEGIAALIDPASLPKAESVERDAYGHRRLGEIPLGLFLRDNVREALAGLGIEMTVVNKEIGYELRCARPLPFDIDYTRTLGYGAVRYLLGGGSGAMLAIVNGRIKPLQLEELIDPATGHIRTRLVDVTAESYQVARSYMIRLEADDLEEPKLSRLAKETNLSPDSFRARFLPAVRAIAQFRRDGGEAAEVQAS
ncbi:MAG TPA: diphosphate--fructose-6-phosphate 1-phosphotransferase [Candidatus Binataceae bacterium]|nr:diphosphate--fructose-6-phosphate 1-phosphotransferase [Candidatus Binataceae bacterium]